MTLQTIVVLVIVAGAAAYLASRNLRMFRGKSGGCGGGCGCSSKSGPGGSKSSEAPLQQVSLRRRDN
jgi:FeoB-associated Cys-rich membrane protein